MKGSPYGSLLTDLYQLTMLQAYFDRGMEEAASFEFFVRKMPEERGFFLAAGLEQVLEYLESLHLTSEELGWLRKTGKFKSEFIDYLVEFKFSGDVFAMPEGTVFFPDEPILRVTAPILQAQFVESRIINILHFQTLVATKAARTVLTAPDKFLVDFGLRRAHGGEAGLFAARASYIAGFTGTSTVLADELYGIPSYGTMAHSFVQAHDVEEESFINFARAIGENVVLLLDTYDTEMAARKVVEIAPKLKGEGVDIGGVRLDSGDLAKHSKKVRKILDEGGLDEISIFVSGNLDEYAIHELLSDGAPIDGFGVGTKMDTSADHSYLDCAYKLVEYAGTPRRKRSEDKATWPGPKQVFRHVDGVGKYEYDVLTTADDGQHGRALIEPVMEGGKRIEPRPELPDIRNRALLGLERLPSDLKKLKPAKRYDVRISNKLQSLADMVDRKEK